MTGWKSKILGKERLKSKGLVKDGLEIKGSG